MHFIVSTTKMSPITVITVVEVVGVMPSGHTSAGWPVAMQMSAASANGAVGIAGNDNLFQCRIQAFRQSGQLDNLTRLARIGYQEQQVVFLQDTQIAMLRFAGMKENRRRPPLEQKVVAMFMAICPALPHATGNQLSPFLWCTLLYNQGELPFRMRPVTGISSTACALRGATIRE